MPPSMRSPRPLIRTTPPPGSMTPSACEPKTGQSKPCMPFRNRSSAMKSGNRPQPPRARSGSRCPAGPAKREFTVYDLGFQQLGVDEASQSLTDYPRLPRRTPASIGYRQRRSLQGDRASERAAAWVAARRTSTGSGPAQHQRNGTSTWNMRGGPAEDPGFHEFSRRRSSATMPSSMPPA